MPMPGLPRIKSIKRIFFWAFAFFAGFEMNDLTHRISQQQQQRAMTGVVLKIFDACRPLIRNSNDGLAQLCPPLLDGNASSSSSSSSTQLSLSKNTPRPVSPSLYVACVTNVSDCSQFRSLLGYIDDVTSAAAAATEELDFPLAFSLLTYENFEQTERLLRLIYRPHNVYCLHVDASSPAEMHLAAEAVASCLPNVINVRRPIDVEWGRISVVEAELTCIRLLLEHDPNWKYFINLVGRDFPLRTNYELVRILKAYNGANDVHEMTKSDTSWYKYAWTKSLLQHGQRKSAPPHAFRIAKGSTHMAVTRAFADFAANDQKAKNLLNWMRDVKIPEEHFFNTLNHNPHLNIPGSHAAGGKLDVNQTMTRLKRWKTSGEHCAGKFIRNICSIGAGDLAWVTASRHMFVNKVRMELDMTAFRCLEKWYIDRVRQETSNASMNNFDVSFYSKLHFVANHV